MHQATNLRPMRAARLRLGLTLLQLAKKCEEHGVTISEGALSRIERGQAAGRPETRAALAAVLDLDAAADFEVTPR
jgi:transcriptional regulator with XRE-family HTH domain